VALLARWPGPRRTRMERFARLLRPTLTGRDPADAGLTSRELEVAALVAEGLSNGEIAERLFISRKTASVHVSNILAKLGAANRTEIATWVVRRRPLPMSSP
jgi:DNA-binding NarL/FixJ family response regulator